MRVPDFELMIELELLRSELCKNCGTYYDNHWIVGETGLRICPVSYSRNGMVMEYVSMTFCDDEWIENNADT